jgi:acyl-coenzyme A synthetase/AMP-(fatty) acid ligase
MINQLTLCDVFLSAKTKWPDRIALVDAEGTWTYAQLYNTALRYALHIRNHTKEDSGCIAIYGSKSLNSIAAILGSMLAGFAYMPIDLTWPAARIESVLKTAKPSLLILTDLNLYLKNQLLQLTDLPPLVDHTTVADLPDSTDNFNLPLIQQEDIAYLLFTSGSTGTPKGVCVSHRAAIAALSMLFEHVPLKASDKIANQAALCYDLTMFDLFSAFSVGASVYLFAAHEVKVPQLFLDRLQAYQITSLFMVSSALEYILKNTDKTYQLYLKNLLLTGDPLSEKLIALIKERAPECIIYNLYSAVEMPYAFAESIHLDDTSRTNLNVFSQCGSLIQFQIKSNEDNQADEGHLIVQSPVLFSGYLQNGISLSEIKNNPISQYETGDWVKLIKSGIALSGRIDRQVKILGNRVELDDIETNLELTPWVQTAAIGFDKTRQRIIAFIETKKTNLDFSDVQTRLKKWCHENLPAVMAPHEYFFINTMPRTTSGKRDRTMLMNNMIAENA